MDRTPGARSRALAVAMMASIAAFHPVTEYLGTHDDHRLLAKLVVLLVGIPLVVTCGAAIQRGAVRQRVHLATLLLGGTLVSGLLLALLLLAVRWASFSIEWLQPRRGAWSAVDAFRIGSAMGISSFALWALAFALPSAVADARLRTLESEKLRSDADLAQLRAHLEPHFLLNTLNAVAGLVTEDPREARRLLASLGDLLRDSLGEEGEIQTLGQQVEWLRRYARILEVRHAGQLAFRWQVDDEVRRVRLPRLLLQPLVENAVKHGALMRRGGGEVVVGARRVGGRVVCTIEDNGPGIRSDATRPGAFGLASVRRRLELQYADAASLRLESSPGGTRSIVELPRDG